jgi:asparagine synthase (glutamine-hydrolysing)
MCGIAGLFSRDGALVLAALPPMVAAQAHRGPDGEGLEFVSTGGIHLGLGQRRLAIIDVSPAGRQPMIHPDTGDQLVYNGELYNTEELRRELPDVRWRGHCDTEVLLHGLARWGTDYLDRLRGMYALAFYDRRAGRLLLARDPVGIKPLYYSALPDAFLFASEVRALLASGVVPRDPDPAAAATMLAYGAIQEPRTYFARIRALPPGSHAIVDLHREPSGLEPSIRRHWRYPTAPAAIPWGDAVATTRSLLEDAVRDHLVSDVPVGVFLSAGLDSTIVASLAARHARDLRTFTVGFAEHPEMSESPLAEATARRIGARHTDVQITGPEAEAAALRWIDSLDQPSVDGLNTFLISQAGRVQGIVVALSGLGGDELFGGYSNFTDAVRMRRLVRSLRFLPGGIRAALGRVAAVRRPPAVAAKIADMLGSNGDLLDLFLHCRRSMSNAQLASLGLEPGPLGLDHRYLPAGALDGVTHSEDDPYWSIAQWESRCYMGNTLLRDSDANGMAHSLEIRVPLLDRRLLDFAFALPDDVRLPDGRANKPLLRAAFAPLLEDDIASRRKSGFTLPIGAWMRGPMRGLCEDALTHLKASGLVRPEGVERIWRSFVDGPDHSRWSRAFSLCVLGLYGRRWSTA